ncbi:MAG: ribosome-binding factor A [marine bacterium B5-7]|nr:MAG: ribosome-binding factor A [marine bacterium B5-7]
MYQQTERTRRVGELIKREVAEILRRDLEADSLKFVNVTAVTVSRDLRNATVFFTLIGDKGDPETAASDLAHARGYVRKLLGARVRMKRTPDIHFKYDDSVTRGFELSKLIDSVRHDDAETDDNE